MKEDYKLNIFDFVPYLGINYYMARNKRSQNTSPRATALLIYNGILAIGVTFSLPAIIEAVNGLEYLLK
ncbi:hypothetical protein HYX16_00360 [Candidatus Woesearchaeota archaeon]|nr:hypothetical protein [Candidatus Woesearchaeota archaeon]